MGQVIFHSSGGPSRKQAYARAGRVHWALLTALSVSHGLVARSEERSRAAVSVSFALESPVLTLHEPVLIRFGVRNTTDEQIELELGFNRKRNFGFIITEPDGTVVDAPRLPTGGFGRSGDLSLAPNSDYSQTLLLNEWHDIPMAGRYRIEAKFLGSILAANGGQIRFEPNHLLLLAVGGRDVKRLNNVCQRLADSAINSSGAVVVMEAAQALSFIVDLIAVPYLERVARRGEPATPIAVRGLTRLAATFGLEVVISRLERRDPQLESSIRSELEHFRLGSTVTD